MGGVQFVEELLVLGLQHGDADLGVITAAGSDNHAAQGQRDNEGFENAVHWFYLPSGPRPLGPGGSSTPPPTTRAGPQVWLRLFSGRVLYAPELLLVLGQLSGQLRLFFLFSS